MEIISHAVNFLCSVNPNNYRIRAGTLTYQSGGTLHTVGEIVVHLGYNSFSFANDIALWRVTPRFTFDSVTAPAALPAQGTDTPPGTIVWVSGWGTTAVSVSFKSIKFVNLIYIKSKHLIPSSSNHQTNIVFQ